MSSSSVPLNLHLSPRLSSFVSSKKLRLTFHRLPSSAIMTSTSSSFLLLLLLFVSLLLFPLILSVDPSVSGTPPGISVALLSSPTPSPSTSSAPPLPPSHLSLPPSTDSKEASTAAVPAGRASLHSTALPPASSPLPPQSPLSSKALVVGTINKEDSVVTDGEEKVDGEEGKSVALSPAHSSQGGLSPAVEGAQSSQGGDVVAAAVGRFYLLSSEHASLSTSSTPNTAVDISPQMLRGVEIRQLGRDEPNEEEERHKKKEEEDTARTTSQRAAKGDDWNITPTILSRIMVMLFMFSIIGVGVCCLYNVDVPTEFREKGLTISKEY